MYTIHYKQLLLEEIRTPIVKYKPVKSPTNKFSHSDNA